MTPLREAERRFRVLVLHSRYRVPGGEEVVVETEAALLRRSGHVVEERTWLNEEVPFGSFGERARAALGAVWNRAAERAVEVAIAATRPDVVHVHNTFPAASPSVIAAAAARGVPVVFTAHNYRLACLNGLLFREGRTCEDCVGRGPWAGVRHSCYRNSRAASAAVAGMLLLHRARGTWSRDVSAFLAVSEHVRDVIRRSGVPADRIAVRRHALTDDPGVGSHAGGFALIVSRLSAEKGVARAVAAWIRAGVPGDLVVAGDGPDRAEVEALAATNPRVRLLGAVERAKVLSLMRDATLLLLPSLWNEPATPPLVAVEAIATGLPILSGDHGGLGTWVRESGTGWTATAGDVASWSAAIARAHDDESGRAKCGEAARREYLEKHSAEACVRVLEETYADICDARSAAGSAEA